MDALKRAETPVGDAGENQDTPAQDVTESTEHEDASLSLEPLNSTETLTNTSGVLKSEARATQEEDTKTETTAEVKKRGPVRLAPPSTWKQNTLMFGSGFALILFLVGGYYTWKSSQLPEPGHFQSATLISEPPVNTRVTAAGNTVETESDPVHVKTVAIPEPAAATAIPSQTQAPQNSTSHQAEHRPTSPIRISKKRKTSRLNSQLSEAWHAYQQQDFNRAEKQYKQALRRYPDNRDAMLGLAAVAMYRHRDAEARYYYERILKIHPGDSVARVALQSLTGSGDTLKDSSQLKHWLQTDPDNPQLHFALGNNFAGSGNWKKAQNAYFEAFRLAPARADYAFNLAVALDQLALQTQALTYYRKARALAGTTVLFSIKQLDQRIARLEQRGSPDS